MCHVHCSAATNILEIKKIKNEKNGLDLISRKKL